MFNVQPFFLLLISKWTNNVSIKMLEIYEMNQYVNLQSPCSYKFNRMCWRVIIGERGTVSCHCGWTVWNKSRFAWGRHSLQSPSAVPRQKPETSHTYTAHTHNQVMLNNAEMHTYRVMIFACVGLQNVFLLSYGYSNRCLIRNNKKSLYCGFINVFSWITFQIRKPKLRKFIFFVFSVGRLFRLHSICWTTKQLHFHRFLTLQLLKTSDYCTEVWLILWYFIIKISLLCCKNINIRINNDIWFLDELFL